MSSSPLPAPTSPPASTSAVQQRKQQADWAYQGLTIAAMLLLLASLWLFR
jgi:hypothetical protein